MKFCNMNKLNFFSCFIFLIFFKVLALKNINMYSNIPERKPYNVLNTKSLKKEPKNFNSFLSLKMLIYDGQKDFHDDFDKIRKYSNDFLIYRKNTIQNLPASYTEYYIMNEFFGKLCSELPCNQELFFEKIKEKKNNDKNNNNEIILESLNIDNLIELLNKLKLTNPNLECYLDTYDVNKKHYIIALCPNSKDKQAFESLFDDSPNNLNNKSEQDFDINQDLDLDLYASDGYDEIKKIKASFKEDHLQVDGKLLFYYYNILPIENIICNVDTNTSMSPIEFTNINLFNPDCIFRLKYNNLIHYFGSKDSDCNSKIKYSVAKIKSLCEKYSKDLGIDSNKHVNANSDKNTFEGFVFYNSFNFDNTLENVIEKKLYKVLINSDNIIINVFDNNNNQTKLNNNLSSNSKNSISIEYKDINWDCNNDSGCTFSEYIIYYTNNNKLDRKTHIEAIMKKIIVGLKLQDANHCSVFKTDMYHVICLVNLYEENNYRGVLSKAVNDNLYNSNNFKDLKNKTKIDIIYTRDSLRSFIEYEVEINSTGIKNINDNTFLVMYKHIKGLNSENCGIIPTPKTLPPQLKEFFPSCCLEYQTDELNYICSSNPSKCYIKIRQLSEKLKENCKSIQEYNSKDANINDIATVPISSEALIYQGNIYKTKGSGKLLKGKVDFNSEKVTIKSYDNSININDPIETTNFICGSGQLCKISKYKELQSIYYTKTQKYWIDNDYKNLLNGINDYNQQYLLSNNINNKNLDNKFESDPEKPKINNNKNNFNINIEDDCFVYTNTDTLNKTSKAFYICLIDSKNNSSLTDYIMSLYNSKVITIKNINQEYKNIPYSYAGRPFNSYILDIKDESDIDTPIESLITLSKDSVSYYRSNNPLVEFTDLIDDNKPNNSFGIEAFPEHLPQGFEKIENIEFKIECCFVLFNKDIPFRKTICFINNPECLYQKMSFTRFIYEKLNHLLNNISDKDSNNIQKLEDKNNDSFNFDIPQKFVKYNSNKEISELMHRSIDNSSNGVLSSYGYYKDLTENINTDGEIIYFIINSEEICLKLNEDSNDCFESHKTNNIELVCGYKVCSPQSYLEYYNRLEENSNYSFLQKSINLFASKMFFPSRFEACLIVDVINPIHITGKRIMLCTIDPKLGSSMKNALYISVYSSLLTLDIKREVREAYIDKDVYESTIIKDGSKTFQNIVQLKNEHILIYFNQFNKEEEKIKYKLDNKSSFSSPTIKSEKKLLENSDNIAPSKTNEEKIYYSDINSDNAGNLCSFWYKDIKVKEKSKVIWDSVQDNNCCFRFFTKSDKKKYEICVNNYNNICIKKAKELMKGIKYQCLKIQGKNLSNYIDPSKKNIENSIYYDKYSLNTIDDSINGYMKLYGYISPLISPKQEPKKNPYYIVIDKSFIKIYDSIDNSQPAHTLTTNLLKYECNSTNLPCTASEFIKFAESKEHLVKNIPLYKIIYDNYRKKLNIQDLENLSYVISIKNNNYLLYPHNTNEFLPLGIAIKTAHEKSYNWIKLSSAPQEDTDKVFAIVYSTNNKVYSNENVVVTQKGIEKVNASVYAKTNKTENLLFDTSLITEDPVTKDKCAIWKKDLKINYEINNNCCFMFVLKNEQPSDNINAVYVCSSKTDTCFSESYSLAKQVYNNCMYGESYSNNNIFPKILLRNDITIEDRYSLIFDNDKVHNNKGIENTLEVSYNLKSAFYKGYINYYDINIHESFNKNVLNEVYYVEFNSDIFKIYDNEFKTKLIDTIKPSTINILCKNNIDKIFTSTEIALEETDNLNIKDMINQFIPCRPSNYINKLPTSANINISNITTTLNLKLKQNELDSESSCFMLERLSFKGKKKTTIICPHILNIKSEHRYLEKNNNNKKSYSDKRFNMANFYGSVLSRIVYMTSIRSKKLLTHENIQLISKLSYNNIKVSKESFQHNEYNNVTVNSNNIMSDSIELYNFNEFDNCSIGINLLYIPENISNNQSENTCAIRIKTTRSYEYIVSNSVMCQPEILSLAKDINTKCVKTKQYLGSNNNNDSLNYIYNEIYFGLPPKTYDLINNLETIKINGNYNAYRLNNISKKHINAKLKSYILKYIVYCRNLYFDMIDDNPQNGLDNDNNNQDYDSSKELVKSDILWKAASKKYKYSTGNNYTLKIENETDYLFIIDKKQFFKTNYFYGIFDGINKISYLNFRDSENPDNLFFVFINNDIISFSNTFDDLLQMMDVQNNLNRYKEYMEIAKIDIYGKDIKISTNNNNNTYQQNNNEESNISNNNLDKKIINEPNFENINRDIQDNIYNKLSEHVN